MITVRPVGMGDVWGILKMGARHHARSAHAHVPFDEHYAGAFLMRAMTNPLGCSILAERRGVLTGFLVGHVTDWPFLKIKVATDLVTLSERAGSGSLLYSKFEQWAWAKGADEVVLGVTFGASQREPSKLFERKGYQRLGGIYSKTRNTCPES